MGSATQYGRYIFYSVDFDQMTGLVDHLARSGQEKRIGYERTPAR